jgi:hypothetical protein
VSVNREGFGGLGVVTPAGGFVYPAHSLAELQAALRRRRFDVEAKDLVLEPRARYSCEQNLIVVRVAHATLGADLAFAAQCSTRVPDAKLVVWGVGLEAVRPEVSRALPQALLHTGFDAEALAAAIVGDEVLDVELRPDADWRGLSLGPTQRLPLWHRRGCTHSCRWCPYVIATGRRIHGRSPARTALEFQRQVAAHRPKRVVFRDPVFGSDVSDALLLLSRIQHLSSNFRAPFEIETRPECLSEHLVDALAAAGCVEVKLGIETFEETALVAGERLLPGMSVADYRESVRVALARLKLRHLPVRVYLMRGLPHSTPRGDDATMAALGDMEEISVHPWRNPEADPEMSA